MLLFLELQVMVHFHQLKHIDKHEQCYNLVDASPNYLEHKYRISIFMMQTQQMATVNEPRISSNQ
jgi:hypothetical protein